MKALVATFNQEKALVAAFNQEKALVGAFSVIAQLHRLIVHSTSPAARSVTQGDDCFLDAK